MGQPQASKRASQLVWLGYAVAALVGYAFAIITVSPREQSRLLRDIGLRLLATAEDVSIEEEHDEEVEEEEHEEEAKLTVIVCIVLFLILLTIAFELLKDYLEEKATRTMEPIIDKLFGELTVLGFLSMFTFVVTKTGAFTFVSERVFGDDVELLEMFEFVHFTLFFIMCGFVAQVLVLVREAMETEKEWEEYERSAEDPSAAISWKRRVQSFYDDGYQEKATILDVIPGIRDIRAQKREDKVMFKALRDEFLLERSVEFPFEPLQEKHRVEPDFNFGRYLGLSMANLLAHIVEVKEITWAFFAVLTLLYYAFCLAVHENMSIICWSWVVIGWFVLIYNIYFERHLIGLRKKFAQKAIFLAARVDDDSGVIENFRNDFTMTERTYLNDIKNGWRRESISNELPGWCHVDLEEFMRTRNWIAKSFVGGHPNRQESLFWMDRKGPKFYILILQVNVIFVGLYAAMLVLGYLQYMWEYEHPAVFGVYLILATIPILGTMFYKKHMVAMLTQVCSVGAQRKPNFIADVLREDKTAHVIRAFIFIYKLGRFASRAADAEYDKEKAAEMMEYFDPIELREVGKTFDAFDSSGDGNISYEEFEDLMNNLGADVSEEEVKAMIAVLDVDGDGEVSRDEFISWYVEHSADDDDMSFHDRAKYLFRMFDTDGSGEVTIGEFKSKLDALNLSITVDEAGAIVKELDEDNSGTIGLHEFETLLERYYPRELRIRTSESHLDLSTRPAEHSSHH